MEFYNEGQDRLRIAVVAKHDFYLTDAKEAFIGLPYNVEVFGDLETLSLGLEKYSKRDLIFFPHFSEIIPEKIYMNFNCIGFHTGDLPGDRGGSPIQNIIQSGRYSTMVSAFRIREGIDSGPIYLQKSIDLSQGSIADMLKSLSQISATMMVEIVLNSPTPIEQRGTGQFIRRRNPQQSVLPMDLANARAVHDHIRMLDGLDYPRAYIEYGNLRIELFSSDFTSEGLSALCSIQIKER